MESLDRLIPNARISDLIDSVNVDSSSIKNKLQIAITCEIKQSQMF